MPRIVVSAKRRYAALSAGASWEVCGDGETGDDDA